MKKLVTVTNKDIKDIIDTSDISLLYPLKDFCVGYTEVFSIDEINDYCLVNRILNDDDLERLESILKNANIKGIVFDDLGIIDVIKDLNITKILLLDHIATNTRSINYYLDYVDSVVVSNDLSEDEIRYIVSNAKKRLVINVFGLKTLMYSRRTLLKNYEEYHKLDKELIMDSKIEDKSFKIIENELGSKFYSYPYFDGTSLLDLENVLFFWYDPILIDAEYLKNVINNDFSNIETSRLFLDNKTIYKVGDIND